MSNPDAYVATGFEARFELLDVVDDPADLIRFSFATDLKSLSQTYQDAAEANDAVFTFSSDTTSTFYARVFDNADGYSTYSMQVIVGGNQADTLTGTSGSDLITLADARKA